MANFLYLFWNKPSDWKTASPEEMERLAKGWMSWIDDLKKSNHLVKTGERLDQTGALVRGKSKTVTDGPYAEAKDIIGGYMMVQADDMAHAVELSKGCPNLEIGGLVEIRPIVSM